MFANSGKLVKFVPPDIWRDLAHPKILAWCPLCQPIQNEDEDCIFTPCVLRS